MTVSAPGKVILFGEHAVLFDKHAIACALDNKRTRLSVYQMPINNKETIIISNNNTSELRVMVELSDFDTVRVEFRLDSAVMQSLESLIKSSDSSENVVDPRIIELIDRQILSQHSVNDNERHVKHLKAAYMAFMYLYIRILFRYRTQSSQDSRADFGSGSSDKGNLYIKCQSDVYIGAGLGSSASYSTCLSAGLLLHFGLIPSRIPPKTIVSSSPSATATLNQKDLDINRVNNMDKDMNDEDVRLINEYAFMAETVIHTRPSGVDNTLAVYGGSLSFRRNYPVRQLHISSYDNKNEENGCLRFLLTHTGQERQTKVLVGKVAEFMKARSAEGAEIMSRIDEIRQAFEHLISGPDLYSSGNGDEEFYEKLEKMIDEDQRLLDALGVGHAAIQTVVEYMHRKLGLHSKLTGAGGGGCVLTLLNPYKLLHNGFDLSVIKGELETEHGMLCDLVTIGGPGVAQHSAELATQENAIYLSSTLPGSK